MLSNWLNTANKEEHVYPICHDFCKNPAESPQTLYHLNFKMSVKIIE